MKRAMISVEEFEKRVMIEVQKRMTEVHSEIFQNGYSEGWDDGKYAGYIEGHDEAERGSLNEDEFDR